MTNYNFTHLTDEQLAQLDLEVVKGLRAIAAYSNRNLAKAKRQSVADYLIEKSRAITAEQMRRDGVAA